MKAVFLKEMSSYFITAVGYVYIAVFYALAGYEYAIIILSGRADLSHEFTFLYTITLLLTPLLTMRLLSEEKKQKTDQMLFSAPVSLGGIVAGKYFAAIAMYLIGIGIVVLHAVFLSPYTEINWVIFWGNMAGIILMGAAAIALGMFISALTENQIVAAVGGIAGMILVISLNSIASVVPIEPLKDLLYSVSFHSRYYSLTMGVFKLSDLVFFVGFAAIFFFLTTRALEKRRWSGQ